MYPPRESPNVLTPRVAGGIGQKVIATQIKQGQKAPLPISREEIGEEENQATQTHRDQARRRIPPPLGHTELSRKRAVRPVTPL